jgi:hypothetical protein
MGLPNLAKSKIGFIFLLVSFFHYVYLYSSSTMLAFYVLSLRVSHQKGVFSDFIW